MPRLPGFRVSFRRPGRFSVRLDRLLALTRTGRLLKWMRSSKSQDHKASSLSSSRQSAPSCPRTPNNSFSGLARRIRDLNPGYPILIVAPWLSSRTREILAAEGTNYLDLTGNARIRLEYPTVIINSQGANRDPFRFHEERLASVDRSCSVDPASLGRGSAIRRQ